MTTMICRLSTSGLVALFLLATPGGARETSPQDGPEAVDVAIRALSRWADRSRTLHWAARITGESTAGGENEGGRGSIVDDKTVEVTINENRLMYRVDAKDAPKLAIGRNSEYSFRASEKRPGVFAIDAYGRPEDLEEEKLSSLVYMEFPYSILGMDIRKILTHEDTESATIDDGGETIVRFSFSISDFELYDGDKIDIRGTVDLAPNEGWAHRSSVISTPRTTVSSYVEYADGPDGDPAPSQIYYSLSDNEGTEVRYNCEFQAWEFDAVADEAAFSTEALGLPSLSSPSATRTINPAYVFLGLGATLGATSLFLKARRGRLH